MRSAIRRASLVFGAVLVCFSSARSETNGGITDDSVSDVGPEAGVVFANIGQPFLFRGDQEVLVTSGRAGIYKSTDDGQSWTRTEPGLVDAFGVEPYVNGLCQSRSTPEVAYAMTLQNGVARTDDFGESWGPLTAQADLYDCAVDPSDPAVLYVVILPVVPPFASQLLKSTDGGRSFSAVGAGLPEFFFGVSIPPASPQTVYVGAYQDGLYVSQDGGLNFDRLPDPPVPFYGVRPTEDGVLLASASNGTALFRSTDGGATFDQVGAGLPHTGSLGLDPANPAVIYEALRVDGLYRSDDGALTFARVDRLGQEQLRGFGVDRVGVRPGAAKGNSVVYIGTSLGPLRSDDNGETFTPIHNGYRGTQVNDLAIDAAGRLLVATINSVGVFRSSSSGTYEHISDMLPSNTITALSAVAAAPDAPDSYVIGGNASLPGERGLFWTNDGGSCWTQAAIPGDPAFFGVRIAYAPSDARRVYAVSSGQTGIYRSDDGARSFDRVSSSLLFASIAVDAHNPDVLYVGSYSLGAGLFKSTDGGHTLQTLFPGSDFAAIALDPQRPEVIYAARKLGAPVRSTNGGVTFTEVGEGLVGDRVLGLGVDPQRPSRLFVWMHAGGLFRSDNGADSWTVVDAGETLRRSTAQAGTTALAIDPRDPQRVYLGNGSVLQVEIAK